MSLKTRCPACDTVFKIVPDQLKVSKGWVRCGRCAEVFDAAAHAAASDDTNPWPQTNAAEAASRSTPAPTNAVIPTNSITAAIDDKVPKDDKDFTFTPKNLAAEATNTPATDNLSYKVDHPETDLSFVRIAKSKAFWQQKNVILSLRAACVGLAGLLFFQVVYSQRNHLVAANPALKSSFETICQTVGCKIEAFKNIDAFKIDSSSFQKVPPTFTAATDATASAQADIFTLKISLKNSSDMPLAMPAIELTLTEASDKPVLRRILLAKDLGFLNATLAANGDWSGEATLAVTANPAMPAISGYRVLLFYP